MTECPKCGKDNGLSFSTGYYCESCKQKGNKMIFIACLILGIIGIFIGSILGVVQYDYEINKCNNLKSTESDYDFDHKIEVDANYNSNCYYINNHPLALIGNILTGALFGILISILIGVVWRIKYI